MKMTRLAILALCLAATVAAAPPTTTVILVRHAEKAGGPDQPRPPACRSDPAPQVNNPPLTPAGEDRAELLAQTFRAHKFNAVYATCYTRTWETVNNTAAAQGLKVRPYDHVNALAQRIRTEHAGHRILVAGHSNTVPRLITALGGAARQPAIRDCEYDRMFTITLDARVTKVAHRRYGELPHSTCGEPSRP